MVGLIRKPIGRLLSVFTLLVLIITLFQTGGKIDYNVIIISVCLGVWILSLIVNHRIAALMQIAVFEVCGMVALAVNTDDSASVLIIFGGIILMDGYGYLQRHRNQKIIAMSLMYIVLVSVLNLANPNVDIYRGSKFIMMAITAMIMLIIVYGYKTKKYENEIQKMNIELKTNKEFYVRREAAIINRQKAYTKSIRSSLKEVVNVTKRTN